MCQTYQAGEASPLSVPSTVMSGLIVGQRAAHAVLRVVGVPTFSPLLCLSSSVCVRPQGKLVKYFSRQLSCKRKVALEERSGELEDFPRLGHWFRIVNLRKEVTQVRLHYPYRESNVLFTWRFSSNPSVVNGVLQEMSPGEVTLEGLLDMGEEQVCELLQKFGANEEECARLNASLSCLRKAHQLGENTETPHKQTFASTETKKEKKNLSRLPALLLDAFPYFIQKYVFRVTQAGKPH